MKYAQSLITHILKWIEIKAFFSYNYKITMSEGKVIPTDIVEFYNQTINNFSSYQH